MTDELIEQARARAEHAYAPFSKFRVGVVVVADDGTTYEGANVENSAYGTSMCAEATAIGNGRSGSYPPQLAACRRDYLDHAGVFR